MKIKKIISLIMTLVLTILLSGNVVEVSEVYAASGKLSKVTSLAQKAPYSTTSITMSWKKHKDATGYEVYRSTSVKGKYTKVATTASTNYKQGKLTRGKTYYYKVRAYKNVNGKKIYGSFSSVKAMGTKPQTPSTKVYAGVGKAKIAWNKISNISGYEIFMSTSQNGDYQKIKTVGSKVTSYLQSKLKENKEYFLKMRSYRTVGGKKIYSSWSSVKSVKTKGKSSDTVKVTSVSLNKTDVKLNKGNIVVLSATVSPVNASNKSVTWSSSNTSVATVSNGTVKAVGKGLATITAKTVDGGKVAKCVISVSEPNAPSTYVPVTGVDLKEAGLVVNYNVPKGMSITIPANVYPANATNKSLIWSSSDESVVKVKDGVATAIGYGEATIIVKTVDGGKTATCQFSVYEYAPPNPYEEIEVTGLILNKESVILNKGESTTLTVTISPSNATNKSVTWSSSNTSVATVSNGVVTAVGKGSATITAKTADGGKTATCTVTVNVPVTGVSLNKTSATLNKGGSTTLTATVNPSDASNKSVTWSSSNTSVATVSNGVVTAVGKGSATITVKTADGGKTATCAVTVKVPVTGVSINKTSVTLNKGGNTTLTATVNPSDASNKSVTWSSSNTSVATVSNGTVKAVGKGSATITVRTADGGKTATCNVTVNVAVTGVSITNKKTLALDCNSNTNHTYQCAVSVSPSDASNKSVTWSSSDTKIATVSSNGLITGVGRGTATITVTTKDGSKKDSFKVYVYKTNAETPSGGQNVYYRVSIASTTNRVMDVNNAETFNGAKVHLYTVNGSDAQLWQFHDYKSKYGGIAIVPKCNNGGFILDVNRGDSYSTAFKENNLIDLWTIGQDNAASMWEMVRIWDGSYIFRLINTNWVAGVTSTATGAQLMLRKFDVFDNNQKWFLEGVNVGDDTQGYVPRLSAPSQSSKYYFGDNIFYISGYGLPNCTAYAYGRAYEILGSKPRLCTGNACDWFGYNSANNFYSRGSTPKLGAIMCWGASSSTGGYGHVAVVEKINSDGTVVISESDYIRQIFFQTNTISADGSYLPAFQGYIYIR